jgi:hypothetical protein
VGHSPSDERTGLSLQLLLGLDSAVNLRFESRMQTIEQGISDSERTDIKAVGMYR